MKTCFVEFCSETLDFLGMFCDSFPADLFEMEKNDQSETEALNRQMASMGPAVPVMKAVALPASLFPQKQSKAGNRRRKRKPKTDPNKPKGYLSAYNIFTKHVRKQIELELKGKEKFAGGTELNNRIVKITAARWKALDGRR